MPTFRKYLRAVLARTWTLYERGQAVRDLIAAIVTLVVAAGFAGWFAKLAESWGLPLQILVGLTGFGVIGFLFLFLFVAPFKVWQENARRIREYEEATCPKLRFETGTSRIFKELRYESHHRAQQVVRIGVRNLSASRAAIHVEVTLRTIIDAGGRSFDPVRSLYPKDQGPEAITINPLDVKYFSLAITRWYTVPDGPDGTVVPGPYFGGSEDLITALPAKFKVSLGSSDSPTLHAFFRIGLDRERGLYLEEWVEEKGAPASGKLAAPAIEPTNTAPV